VRAGYSRRSARQIGARLLARDDIARLVRKTVETRLARIEVKADDVLRELARIGMSSPKALCGQDGKLLSISELSDDAAASIGSFEIAVNDETGQAQLSRVKMADKVAALSQLCRHLGLLAPTMHQHQVITLTPEHLARCTDKQLERIELATVELTAVQDELAQDDNPQSLPATSRP
jgi:phage terminase small subunit